MIRDVAACLVVLVVLSTSCTAQLPARVDPPPYGEAAEIGTAYGVTLACAIPFELGDRWWVWAGGRDPWEVSKQPFPFSVWAPVNPRSVSGIVTLAGPDTADFRSDEDGAEFALTGHASDPTKGAICIG